MKIAIGTANFSNNYGFNNININSSKKIKTILYSAKFLGIDMLDTAPTYGDSEKLLGKNDLSNFKIITKIKILNNRKKKNLKKNLFLQIKKSLFKLGIKKFYAVLIHQGSDLKFEKDKILNLLKYLKKKKLVSKIGISIYDPKELDDIWESWKPDIIQCPLNIFDQRIYDSGWLKKLSEHNIEIHVRSIFLQGLLLQNYKNIPKKFKNWNNNFKEFYILCKKNRINQIDACLNLVKSFKNISYIIVGFNNISQFKKIVLSFKKTSNKKIISLPQKDNHLIDPRLW